MLMKSNLDYCAIGKFERNLQQKSYRLSFWVRVFNWIAIFWDDEDCYYVNDRLINGFFIHTPKAFQLNPPTLAFHWESYSIIEICIFAGLSKKYLENTLSWYLNQGCQVRKIEKLNLAICNFFSNYSCLNPI